MGIAPTGGSTSLPLPRRLRGYDRAQVERALEELAARQQALGGERARLRDELDRLERRQADVAALEGELRDTLLSAQRDAEARRREAEAEAEQLLADARARVGEGGSGLAERRAAVESELERLRELEREFRASARVVVEQALARLDAQPVATPEPAPAVASPPPVAALAVAAAPSPEDDTDSIPIFAEPPEFRPAPAEPPPTAVAPPRASARALRSLVLSGAIVVVGAGVAVGIWQLASDGRPPRAATATPVAETITPPVTAEPATLPPETETQATAPPPETSEPAPPPPAPEKARFAVSAAGGDAWLSVREGSSSGKLVFEGFLYDGESRRFVADRVWMRIGDPTALVVRVNGERVRDLPPGTADVVLTREGIRAVSAG